MNDTIKVALVDDDSIFCFLFKKYMENYPNKKIELKIFSDGIIAAEYFRNNANNASSYPQFLFIDINMPLMNGWELMKTIREEKLFPEKTVRIYIISSSICITDRQNRKDEYQYIEYLTKPINSKTLFDVLDTSKND